MATTSGTAERRAGTIVACAFFSGLAFAVAVAGPDFWSPVPEPYFGLDAPAVEAERPPVVVADDLPADALALSTRPPQDPPHEPPQMPERLALSDAPAPIVQAIVPQALPTAGRFTPPPEPEPRASGNDETPLLSPPVEPEPPVAEDTAEPPATALRALVTRRQADQAEEPKPSPPPAAERPPAPVAAPLPGKEWNDPDGVNWTDAATTGGREAAGGRGRLLERLTERRSELRGEPAAAQPAGGGRLLDRLRDRVGLDQGDEATAAAPSEHRSADSSRWPVPHKLTEQLQKLAADSRGGAAAGWAVDTLGSLQTVTATGGPRDPRGEEPLIALGERVPEGMKVADEAGDAVLASQIRRAALAVSRRVAVWRAAASCCADIEAGPQNPEHGELGPGLTAVSTAPELARLLDALERFESSRAGPDAQAARDALRGIAAAPLASARAVDRAVHDHYLSPNVRIAISEQFVERMLPDSTVTTGPLQDFVLGRKVRGTKTVEQSTTIRFTPHPSEIRLELLVNGEVASRTVAEAGSVTIHSRGLSTFTVFKPINVSPQGLAFGAARGTASNQSRLAGIETGFDSVPLMGTFVRGIVRTQHDENIDQANREVKAKIVSRACHEVDQQTEPRISAAAAKIRERFWKPMEELGLEPTAVSLETATGVATARLRLAAATQLSAHTPRPRAPEGALLSMQVHESSVNNACSRFGLQGQRMGLEDLARFICKRLGVPADVPDDLPEGVEVQFAAVEPLRVECRDGLVHVRVSLDALESGRRNNWYDIVAQVAYRPVVSGMQVMLERDGPVQLSGPGHKGRMEFGLRTIFGKMFPKERPVQLVPEKMLSNPRLAGVQAVQAVCADGWLAIALAATTQAGDAKTSPTARRPPEATQPMLRR
ncbi:MAG: hypothetical protein K8S94_10030 [Planctomycetia bacterium]|nr:hypothetical protein [Planctomycetia bacterium]